MKLSTQNQKPKKLPFQFIFKRLEIKNWILLSI